MYYGFIPLQHNPFDSVLLETQVRSNPKPQTLNYITQYYTKLHYTTLNQTTLLETQVLSNPKPQTLNYTALHYTNLHYTTLNQTTLHYTLH